MKNVAHHFVKISRSQCCFSPDVNIWFDEEYKETVLVFYYEQDEVIQTLEWTVQTVMWLVLLFFNLI